MVERTINLVLFTVVIWRRFISSVWLELNAFNTQVEITLRLLQITHFCVIRSAELQMFKIAVATLPRREVGFKLINFSLQPFFLKLEIIKSSSSGGQIKSNFQEWLLFCLLLTSALQIVWYEHLILPPHRATVSFEELTSRRQTDNL